MHLSGSGRAAGQLSGFSPAAAGGMGGHAVGGGASVSRQISPASLLLSRRTLKKLKNLQTNPFSSLTHVFIYLFRTWCTPYLVFLLAVFHWGL